MGVFLNSDGSLKTCIWAILLVQFGDATHYMVATFSLKNMGGVPPMLWL